MLIYSGKCIVFVILANHFCSNILPVTELCIARMQRQRFEFRGLDVGIPLNSDSSETTVMIFTGTVLGWEIRVAAGASSEAAPRTRLVGCPRARVAGSRTRLARSSSRRVAR